MHVAQPTLTHIRPAKPNGAALLMMPGGGYVRVAVGLEGYAIARRFADAGYHCFVLVYRLPADGWAAGPDAPLQDAQRAMRLIRGSAARDGFDAGRVGVIGFSAGGHLAGRLATVEQSSYTPIDAADAAPFVPQVAGLLYPVMQMAGPFTHKGSRDQMFGASADPARLAAYSVEQHVTPRTPPTFLAAAADDHVVPVENSIGMFAALRAAGVATEMHLFEKGGHGFGLKTPDGRPSPWPDLLLHWAETHGV
jgi:acetyl esterase/lipase